MVQTIENIVSPELAQKLIDFFENKDGKHSHFYKPDTLTDRSYFKKLQITPAQVDLSEYLAILAQKGLTNERLNVRNTWLNVVTQETNQNDPRHWDVSLRSIITFITDNYQGGEFEYCEDFHSKEPHIIKPKKLTTIVMDNPIYHRVLPVTSPGTRLTLITFAGDPYKK